MTISYAEPAADLRAFTCPHCGAYAQMEILRLREQPVMGGAFTATSWTVTRCTIPDCGAEIIWHQANAGGRWG